jgi:hypothetical protein
MIIEMFTIVSEFLMKHNIKYLKVRKEIRFKIMLNHVILFSFSDKFVNV